MKFTIEEREEIEEALRLKRERVKAGKYRFPADDAEGAAEETQIQKAWVTDLSKLIRRFQKGK